VSAIDLSETNRLLKEITTYAESTPVDYEEARRFAERVEEVGRAIEAAVLFSIELKRRRRRDQIEKFLGFQRRILQWVFNAKKIKKQSPA
jgi:hypothetical protein